MDLKKTGAFIAALTVLLLLAALLTAAENMC